MTKTEKKANTVDYYSTDRALVFLEEHEDIDESGNWIVFPENFKLLLEIYKNNENAVRFIKETLAKAKKDFDEGYISLIN